jgi:hypothetical protein
MFYTISGPWFHDSNIAGASLVRTASRRTRKLATSGQLTIKHKCTCSHISSEDEQSDSPPCFCTHPAWGGRVRYLLERRLDRPHNQCGRSNEKALLLPGIEHISTTAQPRQCTDNGIPTPHYILEDLGTLHSMRTERTPQQFAWPAHWSV